MFKCQHSATFNPYNKFNKNRFRLEKPEEFDNLGTFFLSTSSPWSLLRYNKFHYLFSDNKKFMKT